MQAATRNLPAGYEPYKTIDLSNNQRALIVLNVASLVMLVLSGWLLLLLTATIRPEFALAGEFNALGTVLVIIAALLLMVGMIILHEAIHGVFFWIFTHTRPMFGFKGFYAYAAAPDWYILRNPYMIVGIAPLVLITLCGILLLWVVPEWLILPLLFLVVMNASGAVGDIAVVGWLLFQPRDTLIADRGDAMTAYRVEAVDSDGKPV